MVGLGSRGAIDVYDSLRMLHWWHVSHYAVEDENVEFRVCGYGELLDSRQIADDLYETRKLSFG